MKPAIAKNIDDYIAGFPEATQKSLNKIRATIQKVIPKAEETISYGIPTFKINGRYVIYFAGYKNHVSVYPAPRGNPGFKKELSVYKGGKGTVQFPLDKPLPLELITRIAKFRLQANKKEAASTKK